MTIFSKKYELFISYKSEDVHAVRLIADRLLASGKKVWFAEYNILLIDRSRFQEDIDQGIRDSKFGVAFTNDSYIQSKYCQLEMDQLLRFCGPKNIINIQMSPDPAALDKYPELKESPSIKFQDTGEALSFIAHKTGWQIASGTGISPVGAEEYFEGHACEEPYKIDVSGWELIEQSFHGGGPCYLRNIDGFELFWNLQYGKELAPLVYDVRRSSSQRDERALYNELCNYALHYFRDLQPGSRVGGVHLYNINGAIQFAISYFDGHFWKRRYSLMLVHPETYDAVEFVFTFQFSGPFKDYCRLVEIMDNVVYSFEWGISSNAMKSSAGIIDDLPMANKLYDQGLNFAKQGKLAEAVAAWEKVLDYTSLTEMRAAVQFNLGRAFEKMENDQKAIEYYGESIKTNPGQANALCNIGAIYLRTGNPEKALAYFLEAVKLNPSDQIAIKNIVACYTLLGDIAKINEWQSKLG